MFLDVYEKGEFKGRQFRCHGCDCTSKLYKVKGGKDADPVLPKGWGEKTECQYDKRGVMSIRGWSVNYYCPTCHRLELTSRIVAQVLKRFVPKPKKKEKPDEVHAVRPG